MSLGWNPFGEISVGDGGAFVENAQVRLSSQGAIARAGCNRVIDFASFFWYFSFYLLGYTNDGALIESKTTILTYRVDIYKNFTE